MKRVAYMIVGIVGILVVPELRAADEPCRFRWRPGETLLYRLEQETRVTHVTATGSTEMSSQLGQLKRWRVLEIDATGGAVVEVTLEHLRLQQRLPNGQTWEYDSASPAGAPQQLRDQLDPLIGKPLAVLHVDAYGQVRQVKSATAGALYSFQHELPWVIAVPGTPVSTGHAWSRSFVIRLDPPLGTGQQYAAKQKFEVRSVEGALAQISFSTKLKDRPTDPQELLPLLQFLTEGEATFDLQAGRLKAAEVRVDGKVEGHDGPGTRYEFHSRTWETLTEAD